METPKDSLLLGDGATREAMLLTLSPENRAVAEVANKVGDPNHRKFVEAAGSASDWEAKRVNP